jgi:hypothetical protein
MPRVKTVKKNNRGTAHCRVCGEAIKPGETFYTWKKRYGGVSKMHTSHGYPKPSMLSNRKTAQIEDVVQDFGGYDNIEDCQAALNDIAQTARDVGEEYTSGADNMPENLQYSPTAEAMREVGDELERWADELEQWEPEGVEPTEPENEDETLEEAQENWLNEQIEEANNLLYDMPEYQG